MKISIVVPFYKGNQYLDRLFQSIEKVVDYTKAISQYEVIVVNDSPNIKVNLPDVSLNVKLVNNQHNLGIQGSRIKGYNLSSGDWILFLDQDDELIPDKFEQQIYLTQNADVVVGNGLYCLGDINKKIFENYSAMKYLIQEKKFIHIRNLIPSPGECLIRKSMIPMLWKNNILLNNGSDDWFLWLLLFKNKARFICNFESVYIHNDSRGNNLSADLRKMRESSLEMLEVLKNCGVLNNSDIKTLKNAIDFKFYQDTRQLSIEIVLKHLDALIANIIYRIQLNIISKWK